MTADSYLAQIEQAYSRGRGKGSILSPLDWQLAQSWDDRGIPLFIVLRSMSECFANHHRAHRTGTVNTLRYFEQEVEKQFAAWSASQIGKSPEAVVPPENAAEDVVDQLEEIMLAFAEAKRKASPELVELITTAAVALNKLIQDAGDLPAGSVEEVLTVIRSKFDWDLMELTTHEEKTAMMAIIRRDWPAAAVDPEAARKMMLKQLYFKHELPKLTLFEL